MLWNTPPDTIFLEKETTSASMPKCSWHHIFPVAPPPVAAETNYQEQSVQLAKNTTTVTVVPPPTTKPVIAVTPIPNFGKAQTSALFANFVNANGQGQCKNFDFSTLVLPTSTPSARHQQSAVKKQHVAKKPIATATNQITKPKQ